MIAFLFAGQGAQSIGMGADLYENEASFKSTFDLYPETKKIIFEGSKEELDQTKNCQKSILLTSVSIANTLKEKGIEPEFVAGLSLGEYSALTFSKVWSLKDAMSIVTARGEIMQNALPLNTSGMCAVIGLDKEIIKNVLKTINGIVEIANFNCPGQIVITGEKNALEDAMAKLKENGAMRLIPLQVSGAFHSSLLNNASLELRKVLDKYQPNKPGYKVVYNYTGNESDKEINALLEKQICNSVYFEDSIRYMISQGVDTFVEIGPGKTLSSFVKKIDKTVKIFTINDKKSLDEAVGGLL